MGMSRGMLLEAPSQSRYQPLRDSHGPVHVGAVLESLPTTHYTCHRRPL
ncbi:uncharacterized protein METZ01_LOCUS356679 [marine metagenome]|uniref:Uncharacterized protein n=1 Tax=marine metagenome TaxID=408172 RepID=A0A382S2X2_9ZZZZ